MKDIKCKSCAHFRQHYSLDNSRIFRVCCGHCTFPRAKRRLPDASACDKFTLAEPNENAFVTKDYLSKELLQHLLKIELLPPIYDSEESV